MASRGFEIRGCFVGVLNIKGSYHLGIYIGGALFS